MASASTNIALVCMCAAVTVGSLSRHASSEQPSQSESPEAPGSRTDSVRCGADCPNRSYRTGSDLVRDFLGGATFKDGSGVTLGPIMIVTLPDPIASHLDWQYDAELESVRRAFEETNYVIDRYWLPWRTRDDTAASKHGLANMLPGGDRPGVLLFRARNPQELRIGVVYVVGEVPTSGVRVGALRAALDDRKNLLDTFYSCERDAGASARPSTACAKADSLAIRIVGPEFSGSAISLRRTLTAWRTGNHNTSSVEIISGSASDPSISAVLRAADTIGTGQVSFYATVHTSEWLERVAETLITKRLNIPAKEIAFLHEGTTQFGGQAGGVAGMDSTLRVAFPMNISSLRAEYAIHPQVEPPEPNALPHVSQAPERLPLDNREPSSLTESPAIISHLTAPGIELVFDELERTLTTHHIRAVGILATDVRDQLFIADELRHRLRDVQVFIYGSNMLLSRSDYQHALIGSLVFSTYPLVVENQYWDRSHISASERLAFLSDETEGVFNAVLAQLENAPRMRDYSNPLCAPDVDKNCTQLTEPPVWVTAIGADGIYPLAAIDTIGLDQSSSQSTAESRPYMFQRSEPHVDSGEQLGHFWQFVSAVIVLTLAFGMSYFVLQARTRSRIDAVLVFPSDRTNKKRTGVSTSRDDLPALKMRRAAEWASLLLHREMYVTLRLFAWFSGFAAILLVLLRPKAHGIAVAGWIIAVVGLAALAATLVGIVRSAAQSLSVWRLGRGSGLGWFFGAGLHRRSDRWLWRIETFCRIAAFVLGFAYFGLFMAFVWQVLTLQAPSSAFFFQRAVAIGSGLSPAVPLILSAAGFATWCSWHLMRIKLLATPTRFETFVLRQAETEAVAKEAEARVRQHVREARRYVREARLHADRTPVPAAAATDPTVTSLMGEARVSLELAHAVVEEAESEAATRHDGNGDHASPPAPDLRERTKLEDCEEEFQETTREIGLDTTEELFATNERGVPQGMYTRFMKWMDRMHSDRRLADSTAAAQSLHESLFYLIPNPIAFVALLVLVALGAWLWPQFQTSLEAIVLGVSRGSLERPSVFDTLFRLAVLGGIASTIWSVYRLYAVWSAMRSILGEIDPSLVPFFKDLPPILARVTRLTPFGQASRREVDGVLKDKWRRLGTAFAELPQSKATKRLVGDLSAFDRIPADFPVPRVEPDESDDATVTFGRLHSAVASCCNEGLMDLPTGDSAASDTSDRGDAIAVERRWVRALGGVYAVYVADYIDWVFQHLRYLAAFVLVALVLTVVLLSSYAFQPQSLIKAIYFAVLGGTVVIVMTVIIQMDKDAVLSAIRNTVAGKVTWDARFVGTILTYGVIPLLTVVSTEFPAVRGFLFAWIEPLTHLIAH